MPRHIEPSVGRRDARQTAVDTVPGDRHVGLRHMDRWGDDAAAGRAERFDRRAGRWDRRATPAATAGHRPTGRAGATTGRCRAERRIGRSAPSRGCGAPTGCRHNPSPSSTRPRGTHPTTARAGRGRRGIAAAIRRPPMIRSESRAATGARCPARRCTSVTATTWCPQRSVPSTPRAARAAARPARACRGRGG